MPASEAGKLLRVHVSGYDRCGELPLYEAIVEKCRELRIAGATVFRGLEGYGQSTELHRGHFLNRAEQPIVIDVVDTAENIARLVPVVEEMLATGIYGISDVRMRRVQRKLET